MKFWDTSAILPLLVDEPSSSAMRRLLQADLHMVVWWATAAECASGLARLRREDVITTRQESDTLALLDSLRASWTEMLPSESIGTQARRLLRVHALRAADALQLAAAREWHTHASGVDFITLDERLAHAARLEGFNVPEL